MPPPLDFINVAPCFFFEAIWLYATSLVFQLIREFYCCLEVLGELEAHERTSQSASTEETPLPSLCSALNRSSHAIP